LARSAATNSLATLAVILASLQSLGEFVGFGEAGPEVGKHGPSLEVSWVQSDDLGKGRSMSADERGNSRNRSECSGEMHLRVSFGDITELIDTED
jgi:hypothetical protein